MLDCAIPPCSRATAPSGVVMLGGTALLGGTILTGSRDTPRGSAVAASGAAVAGGAQAGGTTLPHDEIPAGRGLEVGGRAACGGSAWASSEILVGQWSGGRRWSPAMPLFRARRALYSCAAALCSPCSCAKLCNSAEWRGHSKRWGRAVPKTLYPGPCHGAGQSPQRPCRLHQACLSSPWKRPDCLCLEPSGWAPKPRLRCYLHWPRPLAAATWGWALRAGH